MRPQPYHPSLDFVFAGFLVAGVEIISSPLSGLASVTPCVVRPVRLTSVTLERITLPDFMIAMT